MGTEDLQGRAGFREGRAKQRVIYRVSSNLHSRWYRGCKDLQGQGRGAFYGSLLGNERLLPLTAVTWGGMWELMALQGASPLFWRSQTGHHGEPALSQHGCMLQLLSAWPQQPQGHSRVSLSHHCPGAVFQGQSWWSVPPGRLQPNPQTPPPGAGGPSFLLANPTVPPHQGLIQLICWQRQRFSRCQGSSRRRDRAARLVTGGQGQGLLSLHPVVGAVSQPQGHQHRHTRVTSPTLQSRFPATSGTQQEPGFGVSPTHATLSTSLWASRSFPCPTAYPELQQGW